MVVIERNAPCPCGSGLKYKKCHLGKPLPGERAAATPAERAGRRNALLLGGVGVAVAIGVGIGMGTYAGLVVAAAWALALAAYLSFRDPPPPNEDAGDPAALNFGRDDR
ncbi:MAG: SEC-C domain-containing protein [Myxococcales bacterium]|nr:SEC-C domain-containing protein [Myxococcales bacterium]